MRNSRLKYTVTANDIVRKRRGQKSVLPALDFQCLREPGPVGRLCWQGVDSLPIVEWTANGMAEVIRHGTRPEAALFADTSFFGTPINDVVWDAILERLLCITPWVAYELREWLGSPRVNARISQYIGQAKGRDDSGVQFLGPAGSILKAHGYDYYRDLLGLRKIFGDVVEDTLVRKLGTKFDPVEFAARCQSETGNRGLMLARKGKAEIERPNFLADEQLVTMAVLNGIRSGEEVIILTRDHDVQDQFFKLITLLEIHYYSMFLADHYAADPGSFKSSALGDGGGRFLGEENVLFATGLESAEAWQSILPRSPHPVMLECWWFTGGPDDLRFARLAYCAEQEMSRLLNVKGRTGGLNTDKLGGKNCHNWPLPEMGGVGMGAIVIDDSIEVLSRRFFVLDMLHSVWNQERVMEVEVR
jgi:hypothetical protein